jgi:hypothetical protein
MRNYNVYSINSLNHVTILFGDLSAKIGMENVFTPTTGNESLHEISNDNGVRVVNFATSKIISLFLQRNVRKFISTLPDEKTHDFVLWFYFR